MMLGLAGHARCIAARALLASVALLTSACRPWEPDGHRLVVATPWSLDECRRLESQFRDWQVDAPQRRGQRVISIDWQPIAAGTDVTRAARSSVAPDLLLGVSTEWLESLEQTADLDPLNGDTDARWIVVRESKVRPAEESGSAARDSAGTASAGHFTPDTRFHDPRQDRVALRSMLGVLGVGDFAAGYGHLVQAAGQAKRAGRGAGGLIEGSSTGLLATETANDGSAGAGWTVWTEGMAIPRRASHREEARVFAAFLRERRDLAETKKRPSAASSTLLDLTADFLGATLVDAQDELWTAWSALERAGYPAQAIRWMTEPPPWPAASITRIIDRQGEDGLAMLETLAAELAPVPSTRAWLTLSWIGSPRPVDLKTLNELAGADDGRLMAEPRVRAWLRAEWTAWARQRYRRVTRWLQSGARDNLALEAKSS